MKRLSLRTLFSSITAVAVATAMAVTAVPTAQATEIGVTDNNPIAVKEISQDGNSITLAKGKWALDTSGREVEVLAENGQILASLPLKANDSKQLFDLTGKVSRDGRTLNLGKIFGTETPAPAIQTQRGLDAFPKHAGKIMKDYDRFLNLMLAEDPLLFAAGMVGGGLTGAAVGMVVFWTMVIIEIFAVGPIALVLMSSALLFFPGLFLLMGWEIATWVLAIGSAATVGVASAFGILLFLGMNSSKPAVKKAAHKVYDGIMKAVSESLS